LSFCLSFTLISAFRFWGGYSSINLALFSSIVFIFLLCAHHSNIRMLFELLRK
jgi:hypothetical protein